MMVVVVGDSYHCVRAVLCVCGVDVVLKWVANK
jgi:hypothetical protein